MSESAICDGVPGGAAGPFPGAVTSALPEALPSGPPSSGPPSSGHPSDAGSPSGPGPAARQAAAGPPALDEAPPPDRIEAMIRAIEKVQALPDLSSTAKAVLIRLTLRYPGRAVRGDCPSPADLAPWLGLSERSIRRAYAELEYEGYIGSPTGPDGKPAYPLYHAAEGDGWPERREDRPMDLTEHVAHLEWLRDLAVSRGRIGVAVTAEKAAGRALGYYGVLRGQIRRPPQVAISGREAEPPPPPAPLSAHPPAAPPSAHLPAVPESAETGAEPDAAGAELARTGSNWHELAETGTVFRTPGDGGFYSKYKVLMAGLPD